MTHPRVFEADVPTGGRPREAVKFAVSSLPKLGPLWKWTVAVGHDVGCPAIGASLDLCNCEIVKLKAQAEGQQSLDSALQDPQFLIGLMQDGIVSGYVEGHQLHGLMTEEEYLASNPDKEEQ